MQIVSRLAYPSSETSTFVGFGGGKGEKMYRAARSSCVKSFIILFLLTLFQAFQNNQTGCFPTDDCVLETKKICSAL